MTFWKWQKVAASNGTADSTCSFPEGMSPAALNDGTRGMMAALAKYRDDMAGAIVTGGSSTAYTVSSNEVFDSLSGLTNQAIAFTPHATNTGACTLNVDGLGAKPIVSTAGVDIPSGTLILGTPYVVTYRADFATPSFVLHGFFGNPYSIPIGGSIDYWGSTAPNSSFALAYGQAISRTTYSTLFSLLGTTYGSGDGTTTFNIPDVRGRVVAGKDDMGGSAASRLSATSITSGSPTTLGGSGGADTKTLVTANLPPYTPAGSITVVSTDSKVVANAGVYSGFSGAGTLNAASGPSGPGGPPSIGPLTSTGSLSGTAQGGTSTAFSLAQPTIIANKLLRII